MKFHSDEPIYKQISDLVCENIMLRRWEEGSRVPSIREMAVETEVNPNTVMRSYASLQEEGVIENRRGLGYFVARGGAARARALKREEFLKRELPRLLHTMQVLEMDPSEIRDRYERYLEESSQ